MTGPRNRSEAETRRAATSPATRAIGDPGTQSGGSAATRGGPAAGQARADDAPTYERARDELAEVVRRLEAGGATLEESLALWERGEELAAICQAWLDGARAKLDAATMERAEPDGARPEPD